MAVIELSGISKDTLCPSSASDNRPPNSGGNSKFLESNGLSTLTGKNAELTEGALVAYSALCTAAQMQLNTELAANGLESVTLTPDNYSKVLLSLIEKMDAKAVKEALIAKGKETSL